MNSDECARARLHQLRRIAAALGEVRVLVDALRHDLRGHLAEVVSALAVEHELDQLDLLDTSTEWETVRNALSDDGEALFSGPPDAE